MTAGGRAAWQISVAAKATDVGLVPCIFWLQVVYYEFEFVDYESRLSVAPADLFARLGGPTLSREAWLP